MDGCPLKTMTLLGLFLTISWLLAVINAEAMGPFNAILQSFATCPASKSGKRVALFASRQEKVSRKNFNLFLDLYIFTTVPESFTISCNLAKKTPQGWKENFFQIDAGPICTALKKYVPAVFDAVAHAMKLTRNDCPLPQGNYTNMKINPNLRVEGIPAFFYTTLKARCTVYDKHHEVQACFDVQGETVPKKP